MTAAQYRRRRGVNPVMVVLLLFVVIVGVLGTLYATGELKMSFLTAQPEDDTPNVDLRGTVPVPIAATSIEPYTKITLAHLLDRSTGTYAQKRMSAESVGDKFIIDVTKIVGRVVKVSIPRGYPFHGGLFLPEGTRSGVVGGIPPGKRGMTVQADLVRGFYGLNAGDRFDLAAASPIATTPEDLGEGLEVAESIKERLKLEAQLKNIDRQANVRIIVQNGVIVEPVRKRAEDFTEHSPLSGAKTKKKEVAELKIAVDPDEVALLMEALAVGDTITCILRSGHADDPVDSITPGLQADIPFSLDPNAPATSGRRRSSGDPIEGNPGGKSLMDAMRQIEVIEGKGGDQKKDFHLVPKKRD